MVLVGLVLSSEELYQSGGLAAPQSTAEDSRMIAFFDSLVQRELTDWSLSGDSSASSNDGDGRRPDSPRPGARNVALLFFDMIFFISIKKHRHFLLQTRVYNWYINQRERNIWKKKCGGAESRGVEIKLPPGAGSVITNCGSGFGPFLIFKDLKQFYRNKSWLLQTFLLFFLQF
jgi:hypothetical protein